MGKAQRCSARSSRTGEPCKRYAILGGTVCPSHGGRSPQAKRKAGERVEKAAVVAEARRLGIAVEVDPGEALLGALYRAWADLAYYDVAVAALTEDQVYAEMFHAATSKGGERSPTGEARRHILIQMREDAQERVAKIAALAIRAGVEERRVRLAEAESRSLAEALIRALGRVDLSKVQVDAIKRELASELRELPAA